MTTERTFPTRLRDWARAHPRLLGASVIVAALALAGIAVIIATTLFSTVPVAGEVDPTPSPSASAAPSATASAQPSASPALSASAEPTPVAGPQWPPVGDPTMENLLPPMWTVAVVNELNIRSGPGTEHPAIGQMNAGDIAKVLEIAEVAGEATIMWYRVAADGAIGYVNVGPPGDRYLLPTKTPWAASAKSLVGVASDGESYLAYGWEHAFDYPPYELHYSPGFALRSDDGITWTPLEPGFETSVRSVAVGEEGWVALVDIPLGGGTAVSYSADGDTWEATPAADSRMTVLAYGPSGFVGVAGDGSWTSSDGRSWEGLHAMPAGADVEELESSDAGYVGFSRTGDSMWATVDGVSWTVVDHGASRVSDAELVADQLHVVLVGEEGATTVRRGTLGAGGVVTWNGPAAAVDAAGFHVDRITQSPEGLLAIGWDEDALIPVTWRSSDGATWERVAPDGMPGVGLFEPVWGSAGWVGPELYRSVDGDEWLAPDYTLAYDGPLPPCPPAEEVSLIVLVYLGRYAERCFADASITIRGYVPTVDGFGGCCPPSGEPGWLAGTFPNAILAVADPVDIGTYDFILQVPPGFDRSLLAFDGSAGWVEVVGHFRDPASESCVSRPRWDFPNPLASHEAMHALCRERFVVESVIQVDGP